MTTARITSKNTITLEEIRAFKRAVDGRHTLVSTMEIKPFGSSLRILFSLGSDFTYTEIYKRAKDDPTKFVKDSKEISAKSTKAIVNQSKNKIQIEDQTPEGAANQPLKLRSLR